MSLWLDASDASTITDSAGAVSQWADKSGNGNHLTQVTAANQPVTGTRTINSRNALKFDGATSYLTGATPGILGDGWTAFVVWSGDDAAAIGALLQNEVSTDPGARWVLYADTRVTPMRFAAVSPLSTDSSTYLGLASRLSGSTTYLSTLQAPTGGGLASGFIDGALAASASWPSLVQPFDEIRVGFQFAGSIYYNGLIAEIRVYNGVLNDAWRQDVERYLAVKWGVTLA